MFAHYGLCHRSVAAGKMPELLGEGRRVIGGIVHEGRFKRITQSVLT